MAIEEPRNTALVADGRTKLRRSAQMLLLNRCGRMAGWRRKSTKSSLPSLP